MKIGYDQLASILDKHVTIPGDATASIALGINLDQLSAGSLVDEVNFETAGTGGILQILFDENRLAASIEIYI